jgi:hypothetical protein
MLEGIVTSHHIFDGWRGAERWNSYLAYASWLTFFRLSVEKKCQFLRAKRVFAKTPKVC